MDALHAFHRLQFQFLRSLRGKLVTFALVFIVPGSTFGLWLIGYQEQTLEERARASLLTDAGRVQDQVNQWLTMQSRVLQLAGTSAVTPRAPRPLAELLTRHHRFFGSWSAILRWNGKVSEASRLDGPVPPLESVLSSSSIQATLTAHQPALVLLPSKRTPREAYILLAEELPASTGWLVALLDPGQSTTFVPDPRLLPKGGASATLSRQGRIVAASLADSFDGQSFGSEHFHRQIIEQGHAVAEVVWPDGSMRLTGGVYMPTTGWSVVVGWPLEFAYGSARTMERLLLILLSMLILVGVGIAWGLARAWSQPAQDLALAAEGFRTGNLDARAPDLGQDEIGQLALSFNRMADRIQATQQALQTKVEAQSEDLSAAEDRMRQLDRTRAHFAANISHELRTPLSVMMAQASAMSEELFGPLTPEQRSALQAVEHAGMQLMTLINELLDLADLSQGALDVSPYEVESCPLLEAVVASFQSLAEAHGIQLELQCAEHLPAMWTDPYRLEQILRQLLSNALKFTPEGGRIGVCARLTDGRLLILVEDNGIGMPADALETLFSGFYQADPTSTRSYGGMGIGLYLAKTLTEKLSGTLTASSFQGQGSTFAVTMPLAADPDAT